MADPIILVGGGGHCRSCIDVIESAGLTVAGILDRSATGTVLSYPVLGDDSRIGELKDGSVFLVTIGHIKSPAARVQLYELLKSSSARMARVLAPSAIVSVHASIGEGSIVMHQAILNAAAVIGNNCIINNKALIEHDSVIGDHSHISTAAVINGGCTIGQRVFIGSNSVVAQGLTISNDVVVGAGAVVVRSITEPGVYAGNPARKLNP